MPDIVRFGNQGDPNEFSPSIWGDCPRHLLNETGRGVYSVSEGLGGVAATLATGVIRPKVDEFSIVATDDVALSFKTGELGGYQRVATPAADNAAATLFLQPLARISKDSGRRVWLEARVELAQINDQAFFFGLANETGLVLNVIANDPSNSAQAGLIDASLLGFVTQQVTSASTKIDAVRRKGGASAVTVLADVSNSQALTDAGLTAGDLSANVEFKLGLRFDGRDRVTFYFNGVPVVRGTIDGTWPVNENLGVVMSLKNGTAAARSMTYDKVAAAGQHS